jgi:glyoxylase-like metal-dependent hydrolase (beta-lactamase superfamily II)
MTFPPSFTRYGLLAAIFTALSLAALHAEAPMARTQAPGFYRLMLGQFEVTALLDGCIDFDAALLRGTSQSELQPLLARQFVENPHKIPSTVNAYLINTGQKLILVDAGGGNLCGPAMGNLSKNLKSAGYRPEQVDAVLLTHLHPDHVAGIVDPAGKPAFANAVVYVSEPESDYWLSTADPKKAPPEYRQHLEGAIRLIHKAAEPYIAAERWKTFSGGELPLAGVRAVPIPGHTPGHTAYEFTSDGRSLLVIGDMIHCMAVQFPRPDVAVNFDSDPKQAVATREALFRRVAAAKTLIAGMHLPFPGVGHLRADANNAYSWVPVEYSPVQK